MVNTIAVYAHIDNEPKENIEDIPNQLDISPSSATQILYSQIVLERGFPLSLQLPSVKPTAIGGMGQTELDTKFTRGIESLKPGKSYTVDDVDVGFAKEFGL